MPAPPGAPPPPPPPPPLPPPAPPMAGMAPPAPPPPPPIGEIPRSSRAACLTSADWMADHHLGDAQNKGAVGADVRLCTLQAKGPLIKNQE